MGFKNRGYKREIPQKLVRDYKLFAIACEGSVREPEYSNLNHFFPELKETKVYLLADALIQSGSYEEFNKFITITIPKLIEEHKAKIKKRKKR